MSTTSVWIGVAVLMSLLLLYNLFFILFYEKLLFQGDALEADYSFDFKFQFEELMLKPESEVTLHGLLLKSDSSKGLILYFHGNRGNLSRWGLIADDLRQYDYDVLIMDYRGYGKSTGLRSESNLYEDAQFVYDYAAQELSYNNIVIHGRSLGTAVATHLATQRPVTHLILETPMTRIREVIPTLELLLVYKPWLQYEFNSIDRIDEIECPITILHGTDDSVVPYKMGRSLYEDIKHPNKKIIKINRGKHNNLDTFEIYQQAIGQILK